MGSGRDDAEFQGLVDALGGHHQHPLALGEPAVDDPHVGDDAAVGVVDRVEDQRPGGRVRVAVRLRDQVDDGVEQFFHALAGLRGDLEHLARVAADDRGQLFRVALGLGGREVDLVQHRDDLEVGVDGQVEVGQRLRLDALRGVDQQDGALAGFEAAGHLVGEVDVAGGVDHVQDVVGVVLLPGQPDRLALDRDAALALDVHPVQVLRAHLPRVDDAGQLQHPVGQGGLAVVDVRDDAEVADHGLVRASRCRCPVPLAGPGQPWPGRSLPPCFHERAVRVARGDAQGIGACGHGSPVGAP